MRMATTNQAKVVPYILVWPSPPPPPSPLGGQTQKDQNNRKRNDKAGLSGLNCSCLPLLLGVLCLATLLAAAIAIPLTVALLITKTEISSTASTTVVLTTITATTVTDTTTTSATTSTTTSISTSTTTTTDLFCSPSCTSQKTCVNGVCVGIGYLSCTLTWSRVGDGDIVVATPNNKIIYYANTGPGSVTDQGVLDVDNQNGTGPENVFWSNSSYVPPSGVYYVCFSQFTFAPTASSTRPITATVKVMRSTSSTLTFTKNFTSSYKDTSACDSASPNLLGSFSYP